MITKHDTAIRVLAFVEQSSLRDMLEMLIDSEEDMDCLGVHTGVSKFIPQLSSVHPDVLLIDADMKGVAVSSLIRFARVHYPEMCIVAQLSGDDNKRVQALLQAGASKCIFKRTTAEQMLELIREVVRERR
jgi:DNA-binding NarL/FixJ family response regulator